MSTMRISILFAISLLLGHTIPAQATAADIQLVLHAPHTTWYIGEQVLITAEVENLSATVAEGVTIISTLPDTLRFVTSINCQSIGQALSCALGQLQSGQVGRISFVLSGQVAETDVSLQAQVVATTVDTNFEDNVAILTVQVSDAPDSDLALHWIENPSTGFVGQAMQYELQVENIGSEVAYEINITIAVPNTLTFDAIMDTCQIQSQLLTCTHTQLAPNNSMNWQFTLIAPVEIQAAQLVASAHMSGVDADMSNNRIDHRLTITLMPPTTADIGLSLAPPTGTWQVGNNLNLAYTLRNAGPASANSITLTAQLPPSLQFVLSDGACISEAGQVRCTLTALPATTEQVINLRVQLLDIRDDMTILASIAARETDPIPENNAQTLVLSASGLRLPTEFPPLLPPPTNNPTLLSTPMPNATPPPMSGLIPALPPAGSGMRQDNVEAPSSRYGWRRYESVDLIQVTGVWDLRSVSNASDHGYHETRSAGATLRYPFDGDGVRIGYRSTVNGAPFHIFLDGDLITSYQTDYAFFVSQTAEQRRTYLTDPVFIAGGYHVLDIVALADGEGSEALNIDFVEIFTGPPMPEQPLVTSVATPIPLPTRVTDIEVLSIPPTPLPTQSPPMARIMIIDVFIAVDHNNNDTREPSEGVAEVPIQVVDAGRNRLLTTALTDVTGFVRVQVMNDNDVVLLIPLLNESFTVRAGRGNEAVQQQWELLLNPAQLPGLIP